MASSRSRTWLAAPSLCMWFAYPHGFSLTRTSSNGGVFGSLYGTPIINLPQAAVLGKSPHRFCSPIAGQATPDQR